MLIFRVSPWFIAVTVAEYEPGGVPRGPDEFALPPQLAIATNPSSKKINADAGRDRRVTRDSFDRKLNKLMTVIANRTATIERSILVGEDIRFQEFGNVELENAVVWTFTTNGRGAAPEIGSEFGVTPQVAAGMLEQFTLKSKVPLKPPNGDACKLYVATWPEVVVAEVAPPVPAPSDTSTPVPVTETDAEGPCTLSAMDRVAVRTPAAVGVKVILIAQLAPAFRIVEQLLVAEKSEPFVSEIEVMSSVDCPGLVSVTD
jgi:hypothetical protein